MLSDPRWTYDDPSGLPDEVPVTLHLPERMLAPVQEAAARDGVTPGAWLLVVVARALSPVRPTHA